MSKEKASRLLFKIVKTRFVLSILIAVFTLIDPRTGDSRLIIVAIFLYIAFNLLSDFLGLSALRLKRIKIIPTIVDIILISFIIYHTGGSNSHWFLIYIFPIVSVSRYLGYKGGLSLAAGIILIYGWLSISITPNSEFDAYLLVLKCLFLLAVAAVAGNLVGIKQAEESRLIKILEDIHSAILSDTKRELVLNLIIEKALEFTNSEIAYIAIPGTEAQNAEIKVVASHPLEYEKQLRRLTEAHSQEVVKSEKPLILNSIKTVTISKCLGRNVPSYLPQPRSALIIPLLREGSVVLVMGVYSRRIFHYTKAEFRKLASLLPLVVMTLKTADLYDEITSAANERKNRLKMLHEIGKRLSSAQNLSELFNTVVELTYERLNSEEAALFIADSEGNDRITKKAVRGPTRDITNKLATIETSYLKGKSLTGGIFESKEPFHSNQISPDVEYVQDYSSILPSKQTLHYIGVPLIIDEEAFGVIRVINKRAASYAYYKGNFELSSAGFDKSEDVELMQTIASQVASAIQNVRFVEQRSYFRNLIISSPDPIIVLDDQGRIVLFNKACEQIWGCKFEEVKGKPVDEFYESKEHAREIGKKLWKAKNHRIQNIEARIKHINGTIIPISLSASILLNKDGIQTGSIGIFKDLREVKKLQEQMMQSEKLAAIGRLTHTVGHELKHNIGAALNYIEVLLFECDKEKDSELSEIYSDIRGTLWDSIDNIQNLLMAVRPRDADKKVADIENVFYGFAEKLERQARIKGIDFSLEYPEHKYKILVDIDQIRQVFTNLFNNSAYAVEERMNSTASMRRGVIGVSTHANGTELTICWKDNGCGIPKQILPNVFTPFFTNKDSGNGLGLFIVRTIVENHNGSISVESEVDKGTTFVIRIPLWSANEDDKSDKPK